MEEIKMEKFVKIFLTVAMMSAVMAFSAFAAPNAEENEIIRLTNEYRQANGLNALAVDDRMEEAATTRALEASVLWSHTRPDGTQWYTANEDLLYGENLASYYTKPENVVNAWINSDAHRENLLKDFDTICVKKVIVNGVPYYAEEFGYFD